WPRSHSARCYAVGVGLRRGAPVITIILLVAAGLTALAQRRDVRGGFSERVRRFDTQPNTPYDGRFAFVRVKYETAPGGYWWRGLPSWAHGFPLAEQTL